MREVGIVNLICYILRFVALNENRKSVEKLGSSLKHLISMSIALSIQMSLFIANSHIKVS